MGVPAKNWRLSRPRFELSNPALSVTEKFKVTLKRIRRLSDSTLDFRFERDDGETVEFEPGQFFRFTFEDDEGEFERSYSLCNFGEEVNRTSFLDLVVSTVEGGRASQVLFNCEAGITVDACGPFGRLLVPAPLPKRLFLVATSVGIAPYMPMLGVLSSALEGEEGEDVEVNLLFGVRTRDEFLYSDEILAINSEFDNFKLAMCYSRNNLEDQQAFEFKGYVTDQLNRLSPAPDTDHVLLCGNPQMIDDCFGLLKSQGFKARQVVREKYVFAKDKKVVKKATLSEEQKRLIAEKLKKFR
jgi:ferredoxin-NADP reductase